MSEAVGVVDVRLISSSKIFEAVGVDGIAEQQNCVDVIAQEIEQHPNSTSSSSTPAPPAKKTQAGKIFDSMKDKNGIVTLDNFSTWFTSYKKQVAQEKKKRKADDVSGGVPESAAKIPAVTPVGATQVNESS